MKKLVLLAIAMLSMGFMACNGNKAGEAQSSAETSEATSAQATEVADSAFATIIKSNEGKTALDAKLFEDSVFTARVKALAGAEYDSIVANFNTQTPIVSENGIYKLSGGKAHAVPEFKTTIIFDSNADNLNIQIEKMDKKNVLKEKDEIKMTETLMKK
jgi:hypothetical protein